LLPVVVDALRAHRSEQLQHRLQCGEGWHDLDLVCERGDGSPMSPDGMTKTFKRIAKAARLDTRTTLHDLRHAFCTELARAGKHPKIVSALAGHSTVGFTLSNYTHAWDEGIDDAAAAIGDALDL
jgi:integrase